MKTIDVCEETKSKAQHFHAIYKAGRVFTKDREVFRTCEVYTAANELAAACGRDLAKFLGEAVDGTANHEILYNMQVIFRQRLGNGYCGVGVWDFDAGICYYAGITRC